jgi:hypothetical protein
LGLRARRAPAAPRVVRPRLSEPTRSHQSGGSTVTSVTAAVLPKAAQGVSVAVRVNENGLGSFSASVLLAILFVVVALAFFPNAQTSMLETLSFALRCFEACLQWCRGAGGQSSSAHPTQLFLGQAPPDVHGWASSAIASPEDISRQRERSDEASWIDGGVPRSDAGGSGVQGCFQQHFGDFCGNADCGPCSCLKREVCEAASGGRSVRDCARF